MKTRVLSLKKVRRMSLRKPSHRAYLNPSQPADPELTTVQKMAMIKVLVERAYLPVLRGEVDIREVFYPAGGWESVEAAHPGFWTLPIVEQFQIAQFG